MEKTLRSMPFTASKILVTGATGYLGALIVASLLRDTTARIVCLTRAVHDRQALLASIVEEWEAQARGCWSDAVEERIEQVALPDDLANVADLAASLQGVDEIVHCAGCLDYYDVDKLQAVNVHYTAHLLVLARRLDLKRFVYVSTAYSSGYQPHCTPEGLLAEPSRDPTQYTRTKREAERLVATSGVPFVVIRPSILIGTSDTGRYSGKRYGLYQQWMGLERLACDRYHEEFHTVAPSMPLNVLHQDAFCNAFKAAYRWLPDGAFMNLVSDPGRSPSMRHLWDMWFEVTRPARVYYYPTLDDVPLKEIHTRQRAYLTFAQVNLEIASHQWTFEATWLELLRMKGLRFDDATVETVRVCQDRFVRSSEQMRKYMLNHGDRLATLPKFIEVEPARSPVQLSAATF
ncbi:SDR family oxidoreductase [Piscinibacter sp.]|jgi:nucleoside-diphosphate-sugar epimerase|uniref:SDR family oxidoreductase n=1 Tax=Piscinibacter sp. TaxID=1903157 RepID=UPI002F3F5397